MIGRRSHDDAQSFEEAWTGGAPRDEHIAALVRLAEDLCEAAVVQPSADFRASLRTQLMAEAETALVPVPAAPRRATVVAPERRPARRRVATLTAALVTSAGVVGIVASSASAVPGDMLYSVKRSVESVELTLHRDDASRGSFELAQASERLAEARKLNAEGKSPELIADTLDDFAASASSGSGKLFTVFNATGEEKPIRKVNDFAAASTVDLSEMSELLPADVKASYTAATEALSSLALEASTLCDSCIPVDVRSLASTVTDLARSTPTKKASSRNDDNTKADPRPAKAAPTKAKPSSAAKDPKPSTAPAPTTPAPAPTTPTRTPSLTTLTDPLIGGLLGDDEQEGLVPGLLNGLLGKPKS